MNNDKTIYINNRPVIWEGETNLLALTRKAHIEIPTFCYHSELSVFGACRLCLVEVEGRGLVTSCSTKPVAGMRIHTHTSQILSLRKTILELLLANHEQSCPTCEKSDSCKLRELANKLGIDKVRFRKTREPKALDTLSDCLVRDPNKCVLCGDCVRYCSEIQGIGAIDFAHRGEGVMVTPAYAKSLAHVDCINCGQCAAVCPTGAIIVKSQTKEIWQQIHDKNKIVVAQIAPAVRVALGEMFNLPSSELTTGKIVTALKMLGFDKVYDTSYAADLTVIEEANEFIGRKNKNEKLPLFTSCCPGWVKYAEQSFPELLDNLSTCRSPQQMLGSIAKQKLPESLNVPVKDICVVSIMPCSAKKFEAKRKEFVNDNIADVDFVMTTNELGKMIKEAGIDFANLEPESIDALLGFATGAGLIFGNSGGVSESVIRYTADALGITYPEELVMQKVRGLDGIREAEIATGSDKIKIAIVHGLKNAAELAKRIINHEASYDLVEVMACPGGCIGGAGQPVSKGKETTQNRTRSLYNADKALQLHRAQDNPFVKRLYKTLLTTPNSKKAHELLHTAYQSRKRIENEEISFSAPSSSERSKIRVCIGTSCFLKGSQDILSKTLKEVEENGLLNHVEVSATFCSEKCDKGPTVALDDLIIHKAAFDDVKTHLAKLTQNLEL